MKDKFTSAYKQWFDRLQEPVPEEVWDNVQEQLDIDSAWDTISERLDQVPVAPPASSSGISWWGPVMMGWVTLFLLVGSFPLNHEMPQAGQTISEQLQGPLADTLIVPSPASAKPSVDAESFAAEGTKESTPVASTEPLQAQAPTQASSDNLATSNHTMTSDGSTYATTHTTGRDQPPLNTRTTEQAQPLTTASIPAEESKAEREGLTGLSPYKWEKDLNHFLKPMPAVNIPADPPFFSVTHVGLTGGWKNTWLLSPETRYGLNPNSLLDTRTSWSPDLGIRIQALIRGRHGVGADLLLVSPARQDYKQYVSARYVDRSIHLQYQRLQLYYLAPLSSRTQVLMGGYVARLQSASEEVGDDNFARTGQFKSIDYGLLLGVQQQFPLWKRWSAQVGMQAIIGLPNIYKGTAQVPAALNVTREAGISLTGGVVYRLKK